MRTRIACPCCEVRVGDDFDEKMMGFSKEKNSNKN
jgi:hypothetical protein